MYTHDNLLISVPSKVVYTLLCSEEVSNAEFRTRCNTNYWREYKERFYVLYNLMLKLMMWKSSRASPLEYPSSHNVSLSCISIIKLDANSDSWLQLTRKLWQTMNNYGDKYRTSQIWLTIENNKTMEVCRRMSSASNISSLVKCNLVFITIKTLKIFSGRRKDRERSWTLQCQNLECVHLKLRVRVHPLCILMTQR
jgi:hypothetical protein